MEAIRNLAREAAAYEDVPAGPPGQAMHRSGIVDAGRSGVEERPEDPATDEVRSLDGDEPRPTAGRHRWSDLEVDVASWLTADELEATRPEGHGEEREPSMPFTPTHAYVTYVRDPDSEGGVWEHDEFMVVGRSAYLRDTWERGDPADLLIDPDGSWWHSTGGCVFDPGDAPLPLPQLDGHESDEGVELTPTGEPIGLHRVHNAVDEDRPDALEAQREDDWPAHQRAVEALDGLAEPDAVDTLPDGGERHGGDDDLERSRTPRGSVHRPSLEGEEDLHTDIENDWAMELE